MTQTPSSEPVIAIADPKPISAPPVPPPPAAKVPGKLSEKATRGTLDKR
tara:strand:+ start:713 stop:859 length:147 start_codon:yes stop_codon:yes gene_type:complete